MKRRPVMLQILNPCSENWDEMTVAEKGKFCTHCQKTVIDVSNLDDQKLAAFLSAQKGSICVRALITQTDRELPQAIPAPGTIYRAAAAIGFSIMLLAGDKSFAKAPYSSMSTFINEDDKDSLMQSADSVLLQGKVVDSGSKPISNVSIKIMSDTSVLSSVISDTEGCFMLWVSKKLIIEKKLLLETDHINYQKTRLWLTKDLTEQSNSLLLRLQTKYTAMEFITIQQLQPQVMGIWYDPTPNLMFKHKIIPIKRFKPVKKKK